MYVVGLRNRDNSVIRNVIFNTSDLSTKMSVRSMTDNIFILQILFVLPSRLGASQDE